MDSVLQQINNAVGRTTAPITKSASAVNNNIQELNQTIGVGKLGVSPIPVPFPHQQMPYGMTHFVLPCALELATDPTTQLWLPCDPQISVSGGNSVVKKEIANGTIKGTIKEFWKNDDYSITIAGILMADENGDLIDYVKQIRSLCEAREVLKITCETINDQFNITHMAVEKFDFPATDGENNQYFTISGISDDSYNLIIE